jgi:hypothetical protein
MTPEEIKRIASEGNVRSGPPSEGWDLDEVIRALIQAQSLGASKIAVSTGLPLNRAGINDENVQISMLVGVQLFEIEGIPEKWVIFQVEGEE